MGDPDRTSPDRTSTIFPFATTIVTFGIDRPFPSKADAARMVMR
jgi:hypothetical protein